MQDAHIHLADEAFFHQRTELLALLRDSGWKSLVVNGTRESDWHRVSQLHSEAPDIIVPSFGLHPWYVSSRSPQWLGTLENTLKEIPSAGVGECGLDRWVENHDIDEQIACLSPQIELATRYNRPLTLHCLKAWGPLLNILRDTETPKRGFLVHAFSGSKETARQLLELGAYFSFSTYFLHPRKSNIRDIYSTLPLDRILLETDAPSMPPPVAHSLHPFSAEINHPLNLIPCSKVFTELRPEHTSTVTEQLTENFTTFFIE